MIPILTQEQSEIALSVGGVAKCISVFNAAESCGLKCSELQCTKCNAHHLSEVDMLGQPLSD